jgi:dTDP-4-amino-4,6-dideoxygalactose transaminase
MIPFSPPRIDQEIIDEVVAVLKSGWITTGPKTKEFERKITAYCGNARTLCVNSATSGLEMMLRWFGVKEGDEVIIPAYTYSATGNVIIHCGATPVLAEVGPDFNISVTAISDLITSRTKVIMPVDFGGMPCDYPAIMSMVNELKIAGKFSPSSDQQEMLGRIMILADAAHSFGATAAGKRSGSFADASVFSFHAVKNLTTAEGGAIALNFETPFDNDEIYNYLNILSLHGQNKDALAKMQKGNWKYDIITAGYKCNMTDISAAIGLVELNRYDSDMLVKRKSICEKYSNFFNLKEWAQIPLFINDNIESSYHLYPLRINGINELHRDQIIQNIFNRDVSVNVHFIPIPMLTFYRNMGYNIDKYPSAYDSYSREISLPVYYDLTNDQVETVCSAVSNAVEEVLKQTTRND